MLSVAPVTLGDITIGGGSPFVLIAGPCVIEGEAHALDVAGRLADIAQRTGVPFIFKA
jgi:2-dehydro-3-deoxyphosphooctonate aldolase (KDO 8-P synthase)